jgi:hypothetical protein
MTNLRFVPPRLLDLYEVHEWRNGLAVLAAARPEEWEDIKAVLLDFRLHHTEIATPGGRKSLIADRIDTAFKLRGWKEKRFDTRIVVDGEEHVSSIRTSSFSSSTTKRFIMGGLSRN